VDGVTTYYVYDGDEVIAEYDVGGLLTAEYTYADSIDEVLTMDRNGNTYYYHYDGLGSVTDVTDAAGAVQESYKYNPYGQPSIFDSLGSPIIHCHRQPVYVHRPGVGRGIFALLLPRQDV